jgi:hypothetical protein
MVLAFLHETHTALKRSHLKKDIKTKVCAPKSDTAARVDRGRAIGMEC